MNKRQNISSGVGKNLFWTFIIKVGCTSAVIFLWDITKKNEKILNYCTEEWHTSTPYDIFAESVHLSNCVFVTRHVALD